MKRTAWLGLLALLAVGCTDNDPGIRRLAKGDRVELVAEGDHQPALKTLGPPPETPIVYLYPEAGTPAVVEADTEPSQLSEPLSAPPGTPKVDFRSVVVRLVGGEHDGAIGAIQRYHLLPATR